MEYIILILYLVLAIIVAIKNNRPTAGKQILDDYLI